MTLKDALQEAKAQLATQTTQAFQEIERQTTSLEALARACQRPHRCWPSRLGWWLVGSLALYLIFMHSFWASERATWEARAIEDVRAFFQPQMDAFLENGAQEMSDRRARWEAFLAQCQAEASLKKKWWQSRTTPPVPSPLPGATRPPVPESDSSASPHTSHPARR